MPRTTDEDNIIAELRSLGIDPKRTSELNDDAELEALAELLKQSLIEDFHTAYGTCGCQFEEEAKSTLSR